MDRLAHPRGQPDFSKRSGCLIGGDPKRLDDSCHGPQRDFPVRRVNIHEFSLSIHASIRDRVTRNRILYHLPCSAFRNFVVSFQTRPGHQDSIYQQRPPNATINVQKESHRHSQTAEKSEPVTRIASSATS